MKRFVTACTLLALLTATAVAQPLVKPFTFVLPTYDSTRSVWFPQLPPDDIDARGFLRTLSDGHLGFADGARARLVGTSLTGTACFPDSATAITTAAHMRKLGINMVRFIYFDYHNFDGASTLAPGFRSDTLSPSQMKRLDWFLYQLKANSIRSHFVLKSRNGPRRDDGVPTWDSAYSNGFYITYFSEPFQRMQQRYMSKLFTHVNPYTGKRYVDDPEIALVTVTDQNTLYDAWINDRLHQRTNVLSYNQGRLLDTLFNNYLRGRYSGTPTLRNVYREGLAAPGPNLVKNPGYESFTDNWSLTVGEGAQASLVIVQGPDVAPGEGTASLRVVIRKSNGNEARAYIDQLGLPVKKNGIYRLRFKARTDSAAGRPIHVVMLRGSTPFDNLGINETPALTTTWQTFDYTFRAIGTDTIGAIMRLYLGRQMGDVFLDGFIFQETGRDGVLPGESLENNTVARARLRDVTKYALRRIQDQTNFYDSLARAYYGSMRTHLRSLGVRAPIAGTNSSASAPDSWAQSDFDFTAETSQWDFSGTRTGTPYSDSTWVMRNYSVLRFRDQKIPEFSHNAMVGKPFIAEQYLHIFPNAHRPEMMIFMPSYAALHDWDGLYFYSYSDRNTEMADRRRVFAGDYSSFIGDPSISSLFPQVSAALRNGWIAPAQRTVHIEYDTPDLRYLPNVYYSRGTTYNIEGTLQNVANMVSAIRLDSFNASRHYTGDDYYVTIPSDDNIQSDTREITLDMTKGVMQLNTPRIQGASGAVSGVSTIRTDNLGVGWISDAPNVTYLWSTLDDLPLDSARRSLLTISTRALNTGAIWQYGDSSIGKNWGVAPTQMESVKLGVNFFTAADSVAVVPLDSTGRESGRSIVAARSTSGSWRVTIDLAAEMTPWYGVRQFFGTSDTSESAVDAEAPAVAVVVGEAMPNPGSDEIRIPLTTPQAPCLARARVVDMLGRTVAVVASHEAPRGSSSLWIDVRGLAPGAYICLIDAGGTSVARRFIVRR